MKNPLAIFQEAGSFIAGLLIGLSIVVCGFAMMVVDPRDWQAFWGSSAHPSSSPSDSRCRSSSLPRRGAGARQILILQPCRSDSSS